MEHICTELNQNTNVNRLECYWFRPVPNLKKKQLWFICCLGSQKQILDGATDTVFRTAILLALPAALLSLGCDAFMFQVNSVFLPKTNCYGNFLLMPFPLVIPQAALLYEPSWQLILAEYLSSYRENGIISEMLLWKSSQFKSICKQRNKVGKRPHLDCSSHAELWILS